MQAPEKQAGIRESQAFRRAWVAVMAGTNRMAVASTMPTWYHMVWHAEMQVLPPICPTPGMPSILLFIFYVGKKSMKSAS